MASLRDLLMLLITVQLHLSSTSSLGVKKNSSTGKRQGAASQSLDEGTSVLALGEACGVYTLTCGRGLRCLPPEGDQSPLQSLLQGKGVCRSIKVSIQRTTTTDSHPPVTESLEKGPCRRLLMSLLQKLELTVIQTDRDIYIPNCDKNGYFKRKQCLSSRGMQRGQCWCVDEKGNKLSSRGRDGAVTCSA
ncbi:insulin-like growth factor-binding protein 6a [Tachysurus fulvidraco]|uniref:insulin-like growth factor-binding protein 6a n=1 Tax=Tachysurus fulvidraco TaxID=1234273 RepID=UPI001FEDBF93|nr:insulin-like growth factor-binding protein 6a [Tachysurus fulvidraco]